MDTGLIITIIILIIYLNIDFLFKNLISVKATTNNEKYTVQDNENKQENANKLGIISNNIRILQRHYNKVETDPIMKRKLQKLNKFNPNNISQNIKNTNSTSYSINKGEHIVLCLRSRDGENRLHDINTIMFVVLHELAHVITDSIGHTLEFKSNFKYLINRAIECEIYKKEDVFKKYCGLQIKI